MNSNTSTACLRTLTKNHSTPRQAPHLSYHANNIAWVRVSSDLSPASLLSLIVVTITCVHNNA
jgi:hypothetical protein